MNIKDKEHHELIEYFDRNFSGRKDKEGKELWSKGYIYQDGGVNEAFINFRKGYALGKSIAYQNQGNENDAD